MKILTKALLAITVLLFSTDVFADGLRRAKALTPKLAQRTFATGELLCVTPRKRDRNGTAGLITASGKVVFHPRAAKKTERAFTKRALKRCKRAARQVERKGSQNDKRNAPSCLNYHGEDEVLNSFDISAFIVAYLSQNADFNLDGVTDSFDLSQFIAAYLQALHGDFECPVPPTPTPTPTPTATPTPNNPIAHVHECNDGIDNDGDGNIDAADHLGATDGAKGASGGCNLVNQQETTNDYGATIFTKSSDTNIIYVDAINGNDVQNGLSESTAVRTIVRGYSLLRSGYPDWLLLRRGQSHALTSSLFIRKSGRSETERMVIGGYGTGLRPRIETGNNSFLVRHAGQGNGALGGSHLAIVGLHAIPHLRLPSDNPIGIIWNGGGQNLLIEDCFFERFGTGIIIQADSSGSPQNVKVRRSVIADSFTAAAHSQGMYAHGNQGLLVEDNVFDHNGWNPEEGAQATAFNHNLYITTSNANVTTRGNLFSRGASHGVQQRSGGLMENNLSVRNSLGLLLGGGDPSPAHISGITGEVVGNVVLEGTDIRSDLPRGWGIELTNIGMSGALVEENIVANNLVESGGSPLRFSATSYGSGVGVNNVLAHRNIVFNWRGAVDFHGPRTSCASPSTFCTVSGNVFRENQVQEPLLNSGTMMSLFSGVLQSQWQFAQNRYHSPTPRFRVGTTGLNFTQWVNATGETGSSVEQQNYPDPFRSVATYNASLGGEGTFEAFIVEARRQSRATWRESYTARAINNYIRAGYGRPSR